MKIYFDYNDPTAVVTNEQAIHNSIRNILGTQIGTLPGKPDFGSRIKELLFDFMDDITKDNLKYFIIEALTKWEPRIYITNIEIESMPEYNRIIASITFVYKLIGKNVVSTANIVLKD